jgi:hypothetical protein
MPAIDLVARAVAGRVPNAKGWIRANCPFCEWRKGSEDKQQSFGVHVTRLWYSCFRCEAKGRLPYDLDEWAEFADQYEEPDSEEQPFLDPPESFVPLAEEPAVSSMTYRRALLYLMRKRQLPLWLIKKVGIGACLEGEFRYRVVVPITDDAGSWLWYVGRTWFGKSYKYPQGDRHGVMFNRAALDEETDVPVLITEGVFDALPYYPYAVACLGKPQDAQLAALAGARRPIVLALDGDAHEEAWAVAMRLRLRGLAHGEIGYAHLPPCRDPADMPDVDALMDHVKWFEGDG